MSENFFDRANNYIRSTESSVVNLLSAIAPWGAPLAPASMAYDNMVHQLRFDHTIAGVIAGVIEVLGLAAVHTALTFWQHNRRYHERDKQQPMGLVIGMFAVYLVVVLTVNVLLEWGRAGAVVIAARALLSLLSVPAAVIMAIRAQHTAQLAQIETDQARASHAQRERDRLEAEKQIRLAEIAAQQAVQIARAEAEARAQVSAARIAARAAARGEVRAGVRSAQPAQEGVRAPVQLHSDAREAAQAAQAVVQPAQRGVYEDFARVQRSRNGAGPMQPAQICAQFSVSRRTAYDWLRKFSSENSAQPASVSHPN